VLQVPDLRWVAGHEAGGEQLGSHGAICDEEPVGVKEFRQTVHGTNLVSSIA
jgi:hypothetical protein